MVIKWSPLAIDSLRNIYEFYLSQIGQEKAYEIISELRNETRYLLIFPEIGSTEMIDNVDYGYRYIVKRHCKIYYTIHSEYIRIAFIWDTRRDPLLLKQIASSSRK